MLFDEHARVYNHLLGFGNVVEQEEVWVTVKFDDFGPLDIPAFDLSFA